MKLTKVLLVNLLVLLASYAYCQNASSTDNLSSQTKEIKLDPSFEHDKWGTSPIDIKYEFAAFTSSFDSNDPAINGKENITWGIPEWVAFEIKKAPKPKKFKRPSPWLTDESLYKKGIAPCDKTYAVSGTRALDVVSTDYRYVRGHLCPFATASRISPEAAWNTCIMMNAVPQLQWQNNGIWKELEINCSDWANKHERVWVICGPVFFNNEPGVWLGQKDEVRAAVPDALFKIVIREADTDTGIETLSFIIPNVLPKDKQLHEFVTCIDKIENLTGLQFLNELSEQKSTIEKAKHEIPPLPASYQNMTKSEKKKFKAQRLKEFHATNKELISSWNLN